MLFIACFAAVTGHSQTYSPITVSGYNHDVIAEGTGPSSLDVTTKEMDAITPSNFVICTQEFAAANSIPSGYGIPNNGSISSGNKSFQLAPLGNGTGIANNVVYLMRGDVGTLMLLTPATFKGFSFLGTATEGAATVSAQVNYTDGTNQVFTLNFLDWVGSTTSILSGFGRVKRIAGPFTTGTYEMGGVNPKLYSAEITVTCSKVVSSIDFANTTPGTNASSNRAFIFAVSGDTATLAVTPVVSAVTDTLCSGQSTVLSIQSPGASLTYDWYAASSGGSALATGTTFTTPNLTGTTIYYVQSTNTGGCSSLRTPFTVTILPPPAKATADTAHICPGQTATLTVTNPTAGITYSWYAAATGGTSFFTGDSYATPALTTNATYYIEAVNAAGCKSLIRTPVTVSVEPEPPAPAATVNSVCPGQTATISITNPNPALTYSYYSTATGGTALAAGTSFTTPPVTGSVTYYIESANTGGCISSTRTPVTVTPAPEPAAPTATVTPVCPGQTATINITNPDATLTYSYYNSATGGAVITTGTSFTTPPVTGTVTYYIEAANAGGCISSTRTPIIVTVAPVPAAPTATTNPVCPGQTATINITNPDATLTYSYYNTATGGAAIATGISFTTPPVTGSVTYYIEAANAGGCISPTRTPVIVTLAPAPAAPVATVTSVCSGQTATINITNPDATLVYSYYTAATGGTAVATGTSYTTPPVTGTVTYYIEAVTSGGCISATRTPVTVTPLPSPAAPVATTTQVCSRQPATITITNPDPTIVYSYYTAPTGGTAVATGNSYTTPPIFINTYYYVEAINASGCSSGRIPVAILLLPLPAAPSATVTPICSGQPATINIANPDPNIVYTYYGTISGGPVLGTGTSFTTPPVFDTLIYFIEVVNANGCMGLIRTPVVVNTLPQPAAPIATAERVCEGETATISITNPDATLTYSYYTPSTGGTALSTGTSYTTPAVTGSVTYYVEAANSTGCISFTRTPVTVNIAPGLLTPVVTVGNITVSSVAFSWDAINGATGYQVSVNGGAFTNPSSGATGLTHIVTGLASGQNVTIAVKALGATACQNSAAGNANAATIAISTEVFIPNTFTPNGDGRNDRFMVYGKDVAALDLKIFNQWGALIFSSTVNNGGWDGTYKGVVQPVAIYVYVANVTLNDGSKVMRKGTVNLVR